MNPQLCPGCPGDPNESCCKPDLRVKVVMERQAAGASVSHTEQMRGALEKIAAWNHHDPMLGVGFGSNGVRDFYRQIARAALAAPAAEVPELPALGISMQLASGELIAGYTVEQVRALLAEQSTRLRGGVPEGVGVRPLQGCRARIITAAPQAPAAALDAGAVRDAASDDMTRKWCWWFGDDEAFHMADTESEAHGEAQGHIDSDCEPGHERKYSVARVQHPIDSLGLDWLARNVAEHIEENVCCWCDDNAGSEEPSIALSKEDQNALGLMVAGFLREKASVDWWTYDKTTITEHAYVSGSNDSAPDAAMSAQGGAA